MKLSEFDFKVPEELIAQRPLEERTASRMMVLCRKTGRVEHRRFLDLPEYLSSGDSMAFNQSRVIKARLIGQRPTGGRVEIFLLRKLAEGRFECLVKATASSKVGLEVDFGGGLSAKIVEKLPDGITYLTELTAYDGRIDFWIDKLGKMPLPPYIKRDADGLDVGRYQTVYAGDPGSVAAPTAGLHFTDATLARIRELGVAIEFVTLHVGLGTFQPIKVEDIDSHKMHEESFSIADGVLSSLSKVRDSGKRVIAVGTTSVRALESAARGFDGVTDLFLRPGEEFKIVNTMFTNFHQPKSSLVVMLSAFVGSRDLLLEAYSKAVEAKYRFFSYGDCMLVL